MNKLGLGSLVLLLGCADAAEVEQPLEAPNTASSKRNGGAQWSESADAAGKPARASDAGSDVAPPLQPEPAPPEERKDNGECSQPGTPIYEFVNLDEGWLYSANPSIPAFGFNSKGVAFRIPATTGTKASAILYLLRNEANGDYLVSTVPSEGAGLGYGAVSTLGTIFLEKVPGSVPLTRYLKHWPKLRHKVSIGVEPTTWEAEPVRGYVCPR